MERIDVVHESCRTRVLAMKLYYNYYRGHPLEFMAIWWCPSCRRDVEPHEILKRYYRWELIKRENLW
jgi:hypothetical protein